MKNLLFFILISGTLLFLYSCNDQELIGVDQDDVVEQLIEDRAPGIDFRDVDYFKCINSSSDCNDDLYQLTIEICATELKIFHLYANYCGSASSTWEYLGIPQPIDASLGLYYIQKCGKIFEEGVVGLPSSDVILLGDVSSVAQTNQGVPLACNGNSSCNSYYEMSPSASIYNFCE